LAWGAALAFFAALASGIVLAIRPRMRNVLLLSLLVGCSGGASEPVHPAATTAAPTTSAPMTTVPPTSAVTPPPSAVDAGRALRAAPTAEQITQAHAHLREARAREAAGDHGAASAEMSAALELVPGDAQLLCEAGYIAHEAGDDRGAAAYIDVALSVFEHTHDPADQQAYAICLFNRGLIREAAHDLAAAANDFAASLALRPNAAVQRHLDAASGVPPFEEMHGEMGGVAVDRLERSLRIHTTDRAQLLDAIAHGFRQLPDYSSEGEDPPQPATVRVLAEQDEMRVIAATSYDGRAETLVVLITQRVGDVTWAAVGDYGAAGDMYNGEIAATGARISQFGPYTRIDLDEQFDFEPGDDGDDEDEAEDDEADDGDDGDDGDDDDDDDEADAADVGDCLFLTTTTSTHAVLCRTSPSLACLDGILVEEGPAGQRLLQPCHDSAGNEVPSPPTPPATRSPSGYTLRTTAPGVVTIGLVHPSRSRDHLVGTRNWDGLCAVPTLQPHDLDDIAWFDGE
jgi:hypothetical protein